MSSKVSIIIPVYNRESLILETLNSIQQQIYKDWECIIIDDHSTDNTLSLVKEFCNEDARFSYYLRPEKKPKGANSCRNYGFLKSKAPECLTYSERVVDACMPALHRGQLVSKPVMCLPMLCDDLLQGSDLRLH